MKKDKVALVHIPKTGGTQLDWKINNKYKEIDPYFYFSFFGWDHSKGGNWYGMPERFEHKPEVFDKIKNNNHFKKSYVVTGHYSYGILKHFNEYNFQPIATIREPISRAISNICQYTFEHKANETNQLPNDIWKFGRHIVPKKGTEEYWDAMYDILEPTELGIIPGFLDHESMMIKNCMTHMIGGTNLAKYTQPDIDQAIKNSSKFVFSNFQDYNTTVTKMTSQVGIDIDLSSNKQGEGDPGKNSNHSKNYGAPDKIYQLIESWNEYDIILYNEIKNNKFNLK